MLPRPISDAGFYHLEAGPGFPKGLKDSMPAIFWAIPSKIHSNSCDNAITILQGSPVAGPHTHKFILISLDSDGKARIHFDIAGTIEGILLEHYHDGLQPTIEMRLPFNYSRIPPWIKGIARFFRTSNMVHEPAVDFPSDRHPEVVDWLRNVADWTQAPSTVRSRSFSWPNGCKAALTISHDVDTDWIFNNAGWIDRICDLEEHFGLQGAWYCVPVYSQSKTAIAGIERLVSRGCEIGCHGYNHDAKWPLLSGQRFEDRAKAVQVFRDRWKVRGFRSEWLWRTPPFLLTIARLFDYDTSVPTVSSFFTSECRNGCGTYFPYVTHGNMIELPLTLPMDDDVHASGLGLEEFWRLQVERALRIIDRGGLVMLSLHVQPHQAANNATLQAVKKAIGELVAVPGLWIARPDRIADWVRSQLSMEHTGCTHECD